MLTDDQRALADGVNRLLADRSSGAYARAVAAEEASWCDLWDKVVELGIPSVAAPEECGGLGLGPIELVAVCETVGRFLAPGPIVASAGGFVPALVAAGDEAARFLTEVVEQGSPAALGFADPHVCLNPIELDGDRISVEGLLIADAERADHVCFAVRLGSGELAVAVVSSDACEISSTNPMDKTHPLGRVRLDQVQARVFTVPSGCNPFVVAFTTAAAELVGMAEQMLRISVKFACEREQFATRIGAFQAVKHRLVDSHMAIERARSLTYRAAVLAAEDAPQSRAGVATAAHLAKASACDAATEVARAAVQVHGGVGITVEHDISLFYLRARQASLMLGGRDFHYAAAIGA